MPEVWEYLEIPLHERRRKPRKNGYTCVMDHSAPLPVMREYLIDHAPYVDSVKFNLAHFYEPVERIREKTQLFHDYGIAVQPSGTYMELGRMFGKESGTLKKLKDLGFTQVEVSASTSAHGRDMAEQSRFAEVARNAGFDVIGEVGKKWPEGDATRRAPDQIDVVETVRQMRAYLDVGVDKFYWEGQILKAVIGDTPAAVAERRESAVAQIKPVVDEIGQDHIIFETSGLFSQALRRLMYLWYIRYFGPDVNIGNCNIDDVGFLESMRRGIAPASGMGRTGDHPWIRSVIAGYGVPSERWWEEAE